jgi:hypothetical protein
MATSKTIYKKLSLQDSQTRTLVSLTPTKKDKVKTIVQNFVAYMKQAHS